MGRSGLRGEHLEPIEAPTPARRSVLARVAGGIGLAVALLLLAGLPLYALSHDRNEDLARRQAELARLQQECRTLELQNREMRQRIRALQEDPRYLEVTARAELGWVKERELLFHFGSSPARRAAPPGAPQ